MAQAPKDYLEVVYDPSSKPVTDYSLRFAAHLARSHGLKPGSTLLDVGCGRGEMLAAFCAQDLECSGIDLAPSAGSLAPQARVQLCDATCQSFPLPDASFDTVFSKSVIEHVTDPGHMLRETLRVLKPGGRLVLLTPDWSSVLHVFYEDPTHVHPYMVKSMGEALKMHGFAEVRCAQLCHHEAIWGGGAAARLAADALAMVLNVPQARRLAALTGISFIRWAVERQVLATARKPA